MRDEAGRESEPRHLCTVGLPPFVRTHIFCLEQRLSIPQALSSGRALSEFSGSIRAIGEHGWWTGASEFGFHGGKRQNLVSNPGTGIHQRSPWSFSHIPSLEVCGGLSEGAATILLTQWEVSYGTTRLLRPPHACNCTGSPHRCLLPASPRVQIRPQSSFSSDVRRH